MVIVSVDDVPGVTEEGESVQPAPVGEPEMLQDKPTGELNPFTAVTEMVEVPELPRETEILPGDALRLKLAAVASVMVVAVDVELW